MAKKKLNINPTNYFETNCDEKFAYCILIPFEVLGDINDKEVLSKPVSEFFLNKVIINKKEYEELINKTTERYI